jgi:hypothetical protein
MKTRNSIFWVSLLIIALTAAGCIDDLFIRGNGILQSETRFARPFNEVNSSGNFNIHISPGDYFEIVVNAESNLLPYIDTEIRNGKLNIGIDGLYGLRNTRPMEVFIVTPVLNAVRLSGSGEITTGHFATDHFEAMISGSGNIETAVDANSANFAISGSGYLDVLGHIRDANMTISGSGEIFAYDLTLVNCRSVISGSGDMYVRAHRSLDVKISGSGNVFYVGNPMITATLSGSGKLIRDN